MTTAPAHPPVRPDPGADRRLTVVLATTAPFVSRAEIAAERLAVGLVARGHRVVVAVGTAGDALERYRAAGLDAVHAPMYLTDKWHWWRYHRARGNLRRLFRRVRPDMIHSNDLQTHQIVSDAARGLGVPRVCHHRFIFPGRAVDWMNKFGAELHVAISRAVRDDLCGASARLAGSRWATVYDGLPIPPEPTASDRVAARRRLGLAADALVVLYAGQIIECKGIADLLRAWAMLPRGHQDRAELVLVGEDRQTGGRYREGMQALARDLGVRARFTGFCPDVGTWQTAAAVAVVPSRVEPLGLVSLEAMARGVPVVGTTAGGIPEVVVAGETGVLVPPAAPPELAAALARLIDDPVARDRLGWAGRRRCEDVFGLTAHVRGVLAAYDAALTLTPRSG